MGYTTYFDGVFKLDKTLTAEQKKTLEDLNEERHGGNMDVHKGKPGFWCQWVPSDDGTEIVWDGGEKFYAYVEWIEYIIKHFIEPWGLKLNGTVEWSGEESDDVGLIVITDNVVRIKNGSIVFEEETPDEITNHIVWEAINKALTGLGMVHNGGGDGAFGFEDEYKKGNYKVTIGMNNNG